MELLGQAQPLIGRDRIAERIEIEQAQDAELERGGVVRLARVADDELDRAAADVDDERLLAAEVDGGARAEIDEARLLLAADDGELDAGLVAHHAHEVAAVLRLAHRRGGDGDDGVDAGALGLRAVAADALGGAGEGVGRDHALERRVAEPHHLLGAIERLDLAVGRDAGDEQVDAVGPDVEGGDLHGWMVIVSLVSDSWQRLRRRSPFDPARADENGLVAIGGSLDPELVLVAYALGRVPLVVGPGDLVVVARPARRLRSRPYKAHRSTRQSVRRGGWRFSVDEAFERVMRECAAPAPGRESTWISEDFVRSYKALHARGYAHSIEVWEGDELVGGLYGVTLGGFFGGESMFNRRTDASKAAVMHLVDRLRAGGFVLCDAQVPTPHLHRLGAVDIGREDYLGRLARALDVDATFGQAEP